MTGPYISGTKSLGGLVGTSRDEPEQGRRFFSGTKSDPHLAKMLAEENASRAGILPFIKGGKK